MDQFAADLHIHSRFSRATSKGLNLRHLAAWGRVKGLRVIGTGDFTHPEWLAEIEGQLTEENENGLFVLKEPAGIEREIPGFEGSFTGTTRFLLQTEISSIYKRGGKVRKVHNLVYMPSIEAVKRFNEKLAQVGNLASDGRPILGLDSRDLLEMVLETDPLAYLIPAHIWTPWFSLFGSKSGFDSVQECYGDLAGEIFAMETGLSSDPEMNWLWSKLDRYRMVSNSDAHSGEKLAREANLFQGEASYEGIYRALRGEGLGHKFLGTLEFFPEEGKYHLDGHRKCGVVMDPVESRARGGICPVCGKPMTLGVLSRIRDLADRAEPERPSGQPGFTSLIPLKEVLGEVLGCGAGTKKVAGLYNGLIGAFGSELKVLRDVPPEDLKRFHPLLAEGMQRMREGQVLRQPGYDGEFGVIRVFTPQERESFHKGKRLVERSCDEPAARARPHAPAPAAQAEPEPEHPLVFNPSQQAAIDAGPGPVLVLAGPGTGKTQTLTGRVMRLVEQGVNPRKILVLTFTRRAAQEMKQRLAALLGDEKLLPQAGTMHALGFDYFTHVYDGPPVVLGEEAAKKIFAQTNPELTGGELARAWNEYILARETLREPEGELAEAGINYTHQKDSWNLTDYTDLLEFLLEQATGELFPRPWEHVLVDEVQDLTPLQLAVVRALAGEEGTNFFAIGDPNQSIYGFRGAAGDVRTRLEAAWPELNVVTLEKSYRSSQQVLDAAGGLFPDAAPLAAHNEIAATMHLFKAPDGLREASWICERIKKLLGATSHSLADAEGHGSLAPGDIAVLVRFRQLIPAIEATLKRHGIPCSVPEAEAFWSEPRVQAILASAGRFLGLALAVAEDDLELPEQVLARGPAGLSAYFKDMPPFDQFFWESKAFKQMSAEFERRGGWAGLINWVSLQSGLELVRRSAEKVQIMTLHAAKGLEFEAVFLPALEDGILPFAGPAVLSGKLSDPGFRMDAFEERRLFYVGLTRAKSGLYLSCAEKRQLFGRELRLPESRFLREIDQTLFARSTMTARKVEKQKQISLLD